MISRLSILTKIWPLALKALGALAVLLGLIQCLALLAVIGVIMDKGPAAPGSLLVSGLLALIIGGLLLEKGFRCLVSPPYKAAASAPLPLAYLVFSLGTLALSTKQTDRWNIAIMSVSLLAASVVYFVSRHRIRCHLRPDPAP